MVKVNIKQKYAIVTQNVCYLRGRVKSVASYHSYMPFDVWGTRYVFGRCFIQILARTPTNLAEVAHLVYWPLQGNTECASLFLIVQQSFYHLPLYIPSIGSVIKETNNA